MCIHRFVLGACAVSVVGCAGPGQARSGARYEPASAATLLTPRDRVRGDLPRIPAAEGSAPRRATYRVCTTPDGARVLEVKPIFGLPRDDAAVVAALQGWAWKPAGPAPAEGPLCFLEHLEFVASGEGRSVAEAYILAPAQRDVRPGDGTPQVPMELGQRYAGHTVVAMYRLCLEPTSGEVREVQPVVPVPGADDGLGATLRSWRYRPTGQPTCLIEALQFALAPPSGERSAPAPVRQADEMSKLPRSSGDVLPPGTVR